MATSVQDFMRKNPHYQGQANVASRTHYAGGILGGIEHFLPAIGSVVGAVGGSLVAPGVGTAGGGAAGGVLGQKVQDWLTGQHSSGKTYLEQGALGTIGGLGKGFSTARGVVNALRAGEGSSVVANTARFGTKGAAALAAEGAASREAPLVASNANAGGGMLSKLSKGADKLGKQAMLAQTGPLGKQGADSAFRDLSSIRKLGYSGFGHAAEHAPAITGPDGALTIARDKIVNSPNASKADASNFIQMAKDHLANTGVSLKKTEKNNILDLMSSIESKHFLGGETPGIVSASNLQGALRDIGKIKSTNPDVKNVINKVYGDVRGTLEDATVSAPVDDVMKSEIVNQLKTAGIDKPQVIRAIRGANTWGDLASIEKNFVTASKVAEEGGKNALRAPIPGTVGRGSPTLTGIANQAGGRVLEKATSASGNLISNLAGKAPKESANLMQLGKNAAKRSVKAQTLSRGALAVLNGASSPNQTTPTDASIPGIPSSLDTPPSTSNDVFSSDNIKAAIIADLAQNGGKHVNELVGLYNTFGKSQNTLSTADQTRYDNLNSALSSLDAAESNLTASGGAKGAVVGQLANIPLLGQYLNSSGAAYEKSKIETATQLAKAITGNSRATGQVIQQYLHSLPDVTDTPQHAADKLATLRTQIMAQAKRFGFTDLAQ